MDRNLKETQISIQVTEERVSGQSFQHLINEAKGEMIFPDGLIQLAVISMYAT